MSDSLQLGNRQLISLKEATLRVPYSRDYIARLAREGKIVAAQYNRQWYIDAEALQNFYETSQLEVRARQEYVRELRRQELLARAELEEKRTQLLKRSLNQKKRAVAVTMQIFVLGLVTGIFVFLTATRLSINYVPGQTASLGEIFLWNQPTEVPKVNHEWYESGLIIDETKPLNLNRGVLLFPDGTSSAAFGDIEAMFSDDVMLEEGSGSTGLIRLRGSSTTVQFVRVPEVAESSVTRPVAE